MTNTFTDKELREEFIKWSKNQKTCFEDDIRDWWLSKFSSYRAYLSEQAAKMQKGSESNDFTEGRFLGGYNQALLDFITKHLT